MVEKIEVKEKTSKFKLGKWGKYIGVGVLLIVFAVVMMGRMEGKDTVKVFVLNGTIVESGTSRSYITPLDVRGKLDSSGGVGAVVLRINSPGGSVVASQEILAAIRAFKEKTNIPVVVSMGELAASGGYYIALGGDVILANAGTLTGSIGVVSQFLYMEGLYEKVGIETEIVKSGKYKDLGVNPLSENERAVMQALSDNIYEQFVNEVANSRGLDVEFVRELATGQVYSGEQAKALGLVDELGTLEDAIDLATKMAGITKPDIVIKKSDGGAFGGLLGAVDKINILFSDMRLGLSVRW